MDMILVGFLFACLYLYFVVVFLCVCFSGVGGGGRERLLYLSSTYSNEVNMGVGYSGV